MTTEAQLEQAIVDSMKDGGTLDEALDRADEGILIMMKMGTPLTLRVASEAREALERIRARMKGKMS